MLVAHMPGGLYENQRLRLLSKKNLEINKKRYSMRQTVSKEIKQNKGNICCNCGSSENIEYHHIVPIALGGNDVESNIVPLCYSCHKAAHNGRHISHYANHRNSGRKTKIPYEDACKVYDMYLNGEIGRIKASEMLECGKGVYIAQQQNFIKYKKERGIDKIKNNIDLIGTNSTLTNGAICGKIYFSDGRQKVMRYKDTGKNDVIYTRRKNCN